MKKAALALTLVLSFSAVTEIQLVKPAKAETICARLFGFGLIVNLVKGQTKKRLPTKQ